MEIVVDVNRFQISNKLPVSPVKLSVCFQNASPAADNAVSDARKEDRKEISVCPDDTKMLAASGFTDPARIS
jgi:hypothetical protein